MDPKMAFHIKVYASSDLLNQPWISDLTHMVNASYRVSHTVKIKFTTTKTRLHADSDLPKELGADGFTAVALVGDGKRQKIEVIGTASMKKWKDDGLWMPTTKHGHDTNSVENEDAANNGSVDQMLHRHAHACPGKLRASCYPKYRGRGIAGHLVTACEEQILRRHQANGKDLSSPLRIMIRVAKEDTGAYWLKQGFTVVGSQKCPAGFWGSLEEFTMWAMMRELSTV
ncbi:Acyl-CoA N-acyltransferase [Penicillium mononematosum]|uniref:Acyl-CoA N-acyltransferase n=1 Tax=Penicillium mononematosum TaxID=268346 RepID=UPI002546C70E|nr:Acyl-CoA N-acyltransferase [Penicillium mononematosum]KAJ6181044.1 Acyl-CoA N-acyltransferase [Penicillium mononematosum]